MDIHPTKRHKSMAAGPSQEEEVHLPPTPTASRGQSYEKINASGSGTVIAGNVYGNVYHTGGSVVEAALSDEQYESLLLKSLAFTGMYMRRNRVARAIPLTCGWLFDHGKYTAWRDDTQLRCHQGLLWIRGQPGTGKSTLIKLALEHVSSLHPPAVTVSYFFNARASSELEKSTIGLYRSLTCQILGQLEHVRTFFATRFQAKVKSDKTVEDWTDEELKVFLTDMMRSCGQLRLEVFIDALDEGEDSDIRDLIAFLDHWSRESIHSNNNNFLRILLSSRHYPKVTMNTGLSFIVEDQPEHSGDLDVYIRTTIQVEDKVLAERLGLAIKAKAGHIFLWTVLIIPFLNRMYDEGCDDVELFEYIESTPIKMHHLYHNLLFERSASTKANPRLFLLVLLASRQLTPAELYALAQPFTSTADTRIVQRTNAELARYMLNRSRGLIEIVETEDGEGAVQFIHETVREFLLRGGGLTRLFPEFGENPTGRGHERVRDLCLEVVDKCDADLQNIEVEKDLQEKKRLTRQLFEVFGGLRYCTQALFQHANLALKHDISQDDFLRSFDAPQSVPFSKWLRLYRLHLSHPRQFTVANMQGLSLLYLLIEFKPHRLKSSNSVDRSDDIVQALLRLGTDVNSGGGRYGAPLSAAIANGRKRLAYELVSHGANISAEGGLFDNAFNVAMTKDDDEIIKLVSKCQARSSPELLSYALWLAMDMNNLFRVKLLIDRGVDISSLFSKTQIALKLRKRPMSMSMRSQTRRPLTAAASKCTADIVSLLLVAGADVNQSDGSQETPLTAAAAAGRADNVELLVQKGAHINKSMPSISTDNGSTAIFAAIINGHNGIVRWLVEHGADVNIVGCFRGHNCYPIHAAIYCRNSSTVRYLVEKGANIDALSPTFGTPLQIAAAEAQLDMVQFLVDEGADVHVEGGAYGNALQAALDEEYADIARLLQAKGAVRCRAETSPSSASEDDGMEEQDDSQPEPIVQPHITRRRSTY